MVIKHPQFPAPGALTVYSVAFTVLFSLSPKSLRGQENRINARIDINRRTTLTGHLHPRALPENDQGVIDPSLQLSSVTLILKMSASQEADLNLLLAGQQDPSSANYHHWLSPEEYATRFGIGLQDLDKIVSWLQGHNLIVTDIARSRNTVTFKGGAQDISNAFDTEIHHYLVNDEVHFANVTAPSIPEAFSTVVKAVHGLNNFRLKPARAWLRKAPQSLTTNTPKPNYTSITGTHYLAPNDFATIYDVTPLYGNGINGSGQKIVVVGQTQVARSDIRQFRAYFSLPASSPEMVLVPGSTDPGVSSNDMPEADLDLEWSGAIAPNATIVYVYSLDVTDAVRYAINQNLAPVLSMSYGACEAETAPSDASTLQSYAMQANAQGITWFAASGDSGASDCYRSTPTPNAGLSVDLPASLPQVTGVGGTEFNEGRGNYWSSSNDSNHASALSYIPEIAWNDSNQDGQPSASGCGASIFFTKPSWQTGTGVPSDGARDVPDVSLAASADHDGYLIYTSGSLSVVGGTSVGVPLFAGIEALLNHYMVSKGFQTTAGLGNINPRLYALAQSGGNVFHDVTAGNNIVPVSCAGAAGNCSSSSVGYYAGMGYDQVTGLGSVDAYNLVLAWPQQSSLATRETPTVVLSSDVSALSSAGSGNVTAVVKGTNNVTPCCAVTFYLGTTELGKVTLTGSGGSVTATLSLSGSQLTSNTNTITAVYSGDSSYNSATASLTITRLSSTSGQPVTAAITNGASFTTTYAPGMVLSIFGSGLAPAIGTATAVPLPTQLAGVSVTINGVAAPLYYISPTQLNVQVPYETGVNTTAQLVINNAGQSASSSFSVAASAPGIFTDQNGVPTPNATGARSQVITLYITGAGAITPAIATGTAPAAGTAAADLPKPIQPLTVTVGGVEASIQFVGEPAGLAGVTQINYQVPAGTATGVQTVLVRVGSVWSSSVQLSVTE